VRPKTGVQNLQEPLKVSRVCERLYDLPGNLVLIAKPSKLKQPGFHEDVAQQLKKFMLIPRWTPGVVTLAQQVNELLVNSSLA